MEWSWKPQYQLFTSSYIYKCSVSVLKPSCLIAINGTQAPSSVNYLLVQTSSARLRALCRNLQCWWTNQKHYTAGQLQPTVCSSLQINLFPFLMFWEGRPTFLMSNNQQLPPADEPKNWLCENVHLKQKKNQRMVPMRTSVHHFRIMHQINKKVMLHVETNTNIV